MASGLFPTTGGFSGMGGSTGVAKPKKTVYTQDGAPVEVDDSTPVSTWQPNTTYAGQYYFGAPPPKPAATSGGYQPGSVSGLSSATTVQPNGENPAGNGSISQGAYEDERQQQNQIQASQLSQQAAEAAKTGQMELAARLQAEAETRRIGMLSSVMAAGTGSQPQVTRGGVAADEGAARSAAFARAKEQAGNTALSSLTALKDVMAGAGKTGSSMEASGIANVVSGGAHDLNEYTRDQLMLDLNRAADIGDQTYQGGITQRGQNMSMMPSLMGLITASGTAY